MVTKEPKSEKTTGRATTKKATAAQPEVSKEGTEATVTSATKTKTSSKATTSTTKAKTKTVAADATETTVTSVTLTTETVAPATTQTVVSEDEIAKQAYILWLERGCPHGDSAQDWFTAIRLLEQV